MAKKAKPNLKKIGHYAFIAGIVLAVLIALIPQIGEKIEPRVIILVLVTLGVIVGLLNITSKETTEFLVAALALIIASSASALTLAAIWTGLTSLLGNVIIFVSPAAIVVALKTVYALAQD